jgi:hypothetical protein
VARAEKLIRASHGEPHRVLVAVGDALGPPLAARGPEQPGVGSHEERAVSRIDAKAMHVNRSRVLYHRRRVALGRLVVVAPTRERG